ncbi:FeoB-associated Cys-rich membrane protein [Butyricicoccus sp. 1XD8-22]|nr:FeoB-associated Cys-rich membrane protein [Butyricicoccus sp. 1XD8-22]
MADFIILTTLAALAALAVRLWHRNGSCQGCKQCPHSTCGCCHKEDEP